MGSLVAQLLGHWTCDQEVVSSWVRFLAVPLPGNNSRQVVHTHVPLSPSSIIWHQPNYRGVNRHWGKLHDALAPYPWSCSVSSCLTEGLMKWSVPPYGPYGSEKRTITYFRDIAVFVRWSFILPYPVYIATAVVVLRGRTNLTHYLVTLNEVTWFMCNVVRNYTEESL